MARGRKSIDFVERNIHGAWVVWGVLGIRQYYYYTKAQAMRMYTAEADEKYWRFVNHPVKAR